MTQLQPAVAATGPVDKALQESAAVAAQQLFSALQAETADDNHFKPQPSTGGTTAITSQNPYTEEVHLTTGFLFWATTHDLGSWFQKLPALIRQGAWEEAFRGYRRMLDGLDLWVADQLRKKGTGTAEEALGNAQQHHAQLRTGLEQIAGKHPKRLPALFHPDAKTVEKEKAAGRPAADTIPLNVYFWKDDADGKVHLYDLTTPAHPHEQSIHGQPTAAMLNTFFEEIARYPEGEVRYTLPGGGAGVAPTTGKTKWYEWIGYAGLAAAGVGLALLTAGASIPATVCFAAGAVAGGISATGHLVDTARLGTATTTTVVLDVAQIVASFTSVGAMGITVKLGGASAAVSSSRWFVPLVSAAAGADVVQLVALTDLTLGELHKIQNGAGTAEDKQRAMAVLFTQLIVVGGLTALSVQGARNLRGLAGTTLEVVEQNGVNVLRVAGEDVPTAPKPSGAPEAGPATAAPEAKRAATEAEVKLATAAEAPQGAKRTTRIGPHDRVDHEPTSSGERIEAEPLTREQRSELVRTKDLNPRRDGKRLAAKTSDDTLAIGRKLASESEGQTILSRLAAGDASALTDIGVKDLPDGYNPALREFALLETRDGYIIVTGGRRRVDIPHGTRLLGHTHPESLDIDGHEHMLDLRHEAGPHKAEVTFAEIARDQRTVGANESGLIPSPADVDAVGDSGYQVLHTRYIHKGGGKIANPSSGANGPRVSVVISQVKTIMSNPAQQTTTYEATFTVRAGGETLWTGKIYAQRVEFGEGRFDQLWFDPPNSVKRHMEAKTP